MVVIEKNINKNNHKKNSKKSSGKTKLNIFIYFFLRFLVVVSLVAQGIHGNWNNVFLCILTLILFTVPDFISNRFNIKLPNTLEVIVYIFIFSSEILGEIQNFYGIFPHWDTMLHTLNGFLCAAVGFSLIDILNRENVHINLSPSFTALVAFCFSMTIGIVWEFCEYSIDYYLNKDMQKDRIINKISSVKLNPDLENNPITINDISKTIIYSDKNKNVTIIEGGYLEVGLIDTMKDLFVNFIGAIVFSCLGYLYIINRDGYKFAEIFIPVLKKI